MYFIHCKCGLTARVNQEDSRRRQDVTICPRCVAEHRLDSGNVLGVDWFDPEITKNAYVWDDSRNSK